jgi:hypothetical protein
LIAERVNSSDGSEDDDARTEVVAVAEAAVSDIGSVLLLLLLLLLLLSLDSFIFAFFSLFLS